MENITINRVVEGKIVQERNVANISPLWQQRMEQEDRTRALRAGATGSKAHPASLTPQGGARTGGLADLSTLPTR